MIEVSGLTLLMGGTRVLSDVSFAVDAGKVLLVTGANGAGKSLLARAVAGLQPVTAGRVLINGGDIRRWRARHRVGYLPQNGGLYEDLTVLENLQFFTALAGVGWRQRAKVCADLLELAGLGAAGGLLAGRLTPGQRQRLCLARTLAGDPPVLMLDEPLAGLDAEARGDFRHLLGELAAMGKAILITTGDPDGLPFDRHLVLSQGRVKGGEVA